MSRTLTAHLKQLQCKVLPDGHLPGHSHDPVADGTTGHRKDMSMANPTRTETYKVSRENPRCSLQCFQVSTFIEDT